MAKPSGPTCNLNCDYCYYLEKKSMFREKGSCRMSDAVLEIFTRQYIEAQHTNEIVFAWQGGEPILAGRDFFEKALYYQRVYGEGRHITNSIQTNGTLLSDDWAAFFAEHQFLVGVSIDGPAVYHDRHRKDRSGHPTHKQVIQGLRLLQKHHVEFNILCVVSDANAAHPLEVYRYFKEIGATFIQFIPLVERKPSPSDCDCGRALSSPPDLAKKEEHEEVMSWTVDPEAYGLFLCRLFDEWVRKDVGTIFIQLFDVTLGAWMGLEPALCTFARTCGNGLLLEHNGHLYACDHYVYPEYRLGTVTTTPLATLAHSARQVQFGMDKAEKLPRYCRQCPYLFACNGGCPKHRFKKTPTGEPGLSYLCEGYRMYFEHTKPYMEMMARLLKSGQPATGIMELLNSNVSREPQIGAANADSR